MNIVAALGATGGDGRGHRLGADEAAGGHVVAHTLTQREAKGPDSDCTAGVILAGPLGGGNDGTGRRSEDDPNLVVAQCHGSNVGPMGELRRGSGGVTGGVPFVIKGAAIGRKPDAGPQYGEVLQDGSVYTLNATEVHAVAHAQLVAFDTTQITSGKNCSNPQAGDALAGVTPRRLTPRECERLQGFPDDWTRWREDGSEIADSPRYRMLGNAVCVPVAEWIGKRITQAAQHEAKP